MKQDVKWDEVFKKYAGFKLSDSEFCKQENLPPSTFYKQKKVRGIARPYRKRNKASKSTVKPELIELNIKPDKTIDTVVNIPTIRLSNANGVIVEVYL